MAYAALSSLMHALQQLLQPNQSLVCVSCIQQHAESACQNLSALQVFLEDTTKEAKDIETLKILEKRIRDVVYKAEDRVDSSLTRVILADNGDARECRSFYEELKEVEKEVYFLGKEMMLIEFNKHGRKSTEATTPPSSRSRKEMMLIEFNKHGSKSIEATTPSSSRRYATEHNTVVGMEDDFNSIIDRLTKQTDELTVIPIAGMGVIGKTTLAKKICDDSSIQHRFDKHAWVTVSENYNERRMLLEVVSSITGINQEINNDQLMEIVYKGLKGRRFLVVIDDIWSTEAWDQMRRIFPDDNNKSRILLTTRLKYVADYAGCLDFPSHGMSFLSFRDSWILFTRRLFRKDPYPPQLEEIGKHIVQQCRGLPLSIVVVAGLLGKMEPTHDNWKKVEENLDSFFGMVSEQCQAILSLSYSYLPPHLKACFLYVGGFPEDMEIYVSTLTRLWIAEQFIKARSSKRLGVVAAEYLEELIDRSLILAGKLKANGRMKTCKIHDLLRQLCIREARTEIFVHVKNENAPIFSEGINYQRRVIVPLDIHYNNVISHWHGSGIISTNRSLVFTSNNLYYYKRPCNIISHFELLKVLDISSIGYNFSDVAPQLVHLRYVAANIDEAPSLAKLWNLQTTILDKRGGLTDSELPLEIWTTSQIRHLDIGWNIHLPNPREAESHGEPPLFLNNLQTLALSFAPFLAEIIRRAPNLKKLKIVDIKHGHWPVILDSLILLQELETLNIEAESHIDPMIISRDIFPPSLKQLKLSYSSIPWDDMVVLANLIYPILRCSKGIMHLMEPIGD